MNRINNIEDLLSERKRIEAQIAEQKLVLKEEFTAIRSKLMPFLNLLPVLNIFRKKETRQPLLSSVSSLGIDLVGQTFLSKASWVTRFIVPLIAKGISSTILRKKKIENSVSDNGY